MGLLKYRERVGKGIHHLLLEFPCGFERVRGERVSGRKTGGSDGKAINSRRG